MDYLKNYRNTLFSSIKSLLIGMKTTMKVFCRKKSTEQYPENRATLQMFERYRGELIMPDASKCVVCGLCQIACPNETIHVVSESRTNEEGKKEKFLIEYNYDLGSCMFCQLCVNACPHGAIRFDTTFENAVYTRKKLVKTLNHK